MQLWDAHQINVFVSFCREFPRDIQDPANSDPAHPVSQWPALLVSTAKFITKESHMEYAVNRPEREVAMEDWSAITGSCGAVRQTAGTKRDPMS